MNEVILTENKRKLSPIFKNGNIQLFCSSVLDINILNSDSVDLFVTSPPYNLGIDYNSVIDDNDYEQYLEFTEKWLYNCFLWGKNGARLCLNIPLDKNKGGIQSVSSDFIQIAKKIGWKYHTTIVWNESNISRRTAWGSWLSASAPYVIAPVELIVILYKNTWKKPYKGISDISKSEFLEWTNGLWSFNGESKKRIGHPAPFPRELPKRCIKLFSYINDMVCDPFNGSGTTMIEAFVNNRQFIGLEIDREYCSLSMNRINKIMKQ